MPLPLSTDDEVAPLVPPARTDSNASSNSDAAGASSDGSADVGAGGALRARREQNRVSARRSRVKKKALMSAVHEVVEQQARSIADLEFKIGALEGVLHAARAATAAAAAAAGDCSGGVAHAEPHPALTADNDDANHYQAGQPPLREGMAKAELLAATLYDSLAADVAYGGAVSLAAAPELMMIDASGAADDDAGAMLSAPYACAPPAIEAQASAPVPALALLRCDDPYRAYNGVQDPMPEMSLPGWV
jgi:hypothetical protein